MIFKTLSLIYPDFLRGKSDEDVKYAKRIWLNTLADCRADCVDQVLARVPDEFPSYAPKIGEFKQMMPRMEMRRLEIIDTRMGDHAWEPSHNEVNRKAREELLNLVGAKILPLEEGEKSR